MTDRCFIAVDLSDDVRDRLARFLRDVSRGTKGFAWVDPMNLHLTLRFLGEIDDGVRDSVVARLETVVSTEGSLSLMARGVGFFPDAKRPRIVWAGLEGDVGRLQALQTRIEEAVDGLKVHPREDRPFVPHLTIARVKDFRTATGVARVLHSVLQSPSEAEFGSFAVKSLFLYKSDLTPKGPRYTKLNEFHLQGETLNGHQS